MKNFEIIEELGVGSFGKVHLAMHKGTGEKVAIKTISKQKLKSKQDIQMINKQITIFKAVQHPNIIKLYEIFQDPNSLYLVMEHADCGDLLSYVKGYGTVSQHLALVYMRQLASAVSYLHLQKNIAHRDIKLANILLCSKQNCIKLADFGLSNFYQPHTQLKTSCGSPCYSAPEILIGARYNPLAADIWSLGVVLYAMIEGYLPFYNENIKQLYKQVIKGKYCQHEKAQKQIKQLIQQILQINSQSRIGIKQLINKINGLLNQRQKGRQRQVEGEEERQRRGQKNQLFNITIPKLSKQSYNYVEYLKIENIKKIMKIKGFEESLIQSTFYFRKKYSKPHKFNEMNTYIQLLSNMPMNKLSHMLQDLLHYKCVKTQGDEISLKRNYSSFTRDTLKGSNAEQKKGTKIRFVRNGGMKQKYTLNKMDDVGLNRQNKKMQQVKRAPITKHKRKRSELAMSLHVTQEREELDRMKQREQIKYGYIKLNLKQNQNLNNQENGQECDNLESERLEKRAVQAKRQSMKLNLSLRKESVCYVEHLQDMDRTKQELSNENVNGSVNGKMNGNMNGSVNIGIRTQRIESNQFQNALKTYKGVFNIMHTSNTNFNPTAFPSKLQHLATTKQLKQVKILSDLKYQIIDNRNIKYQVEIFKIENFRSLHLIQISPVFNTNIFRQVKSVMRECDSQ